MRIKRVQSDRRAGRPQDPARPIVDLALTIEEIERDLQFGAGSIPVGSAIRATELPVSPRR